VYAQVSDGAAAVLVMSRKKANQLGLKPLGAFRSFAVAGVEPDIMGYEHVCVCACDSRMYITHNHIHARVSINHIVICMPLCQPHPASALWLRSPSRWRSPT
jgi:hypothetical protein